VLAEQTVSDLEAQRDLDMDEMRGLRTRLDLVEAALADERRAGDRLRDSAARGATTADTEAALATQLQTAVNDVDEMRRLLMCVVPRALPLPSATVDYLLNGVPAPPPPLGPLPQRGARLVQGGPGGQHHPDGPARRRAGEAGRAGGARPTFGPLPTPSIGPLSAPYLGPL